MSSPIWNRRRQNSRLDTMDRKNAREDLVGARLALLRWMELTPPFEESYEFGVGPEWTRCAICGRESDHPIMYCYLAPCPSVGFDQDA